MYVLSVEALLNKCIAQPQLILPYNIDTLDIRISSGGRAILNLRVTASLTTGDARHRFPIQTDLCGHQHISTTWSNECPGVIVVVL